MTKMRAIGCLLAVCCGTVCADLMQVKIGEVGVYAPWGNYVTNTASYPFTASIAVTNGAGDVGTFDLVMSSTAEGAQVYFNGTDGIRIGIDSASDSTAFIESGEPLYMTFTNVSANITNLTLRIVESYNLLTGESVMMYDGDGNSQTLVGDTVNQTLHSVDSALQSIDLSGEAFRFETQSGSWCFADIELDVGVTAVPEPATSGLFTISLFGLGVVRKVLGAECGKRG